MQELSAIVPAHKKQTIIEIAVRNIYELWLGLAKDTMRSVRPDLSPNELYSWSAIYVAAADAFKSNYFVLVFCANCMFFSSF
jgi:hypothetical protein